MAAHPGSPAFTKTFQSEATINRTTASQTMVNPKPNIAANGETCGVASDWNNRNRSDEAICELPPMFCFQGRVVGCEEMLIVNLNAPRFHFFHHFCAPAAVLR
jgi:hypothetical protein